MKYSTLLCSGEMCWKQAKRARLVNVLRETLMYGVDEKDVDKACDLCKKEGGFCCCFWS